MIDLTIIEAAFIAAIPTLTAVASIVAVAVKIIKSLNSLKENELLKIERDELKAQNELLIKEVRKQNKLTKLYIEKVGKVVFSDMSEVKDDQDLQD